MQTSPPAGPAPNSGRPAHKPAPGQTFALKVGELYVPEGYRAVRDVTVTVHFHGAAWASEGAFRDARSPGVLVTVIEPGLSAAYSKPFTADPALFGHILEDTLAVMQAHQLAPADASVASLRVSSFSAGYGAVRAILKQPEYVRKIDALILCDSLHTGFRDTRKRVVDRSLLEPFEQFALLAASGKKTFLLTHSQVQPPDYASTTETADDLLQTIGAHRRPAGPESPATGSDQESDQKTEEEPWPTGITVLTRADKGRFHLWGCAGDTGPDHMRQLYALAFWYERLNAIL